MWWALRQGEGEGDTGFDTGFDTGERLEEVALGSGHIVPVHFGDDVAAHQIRIGGGAVGAHESNFRFDIFGFGGRISQRGKRALRLCCCGGSLITARCHDSVLLMKLTGRSCVLLALVLSTLSCGEKTAPKPQASAVSEPSPEDSAELKQEIISALTASQKAGFERHDIDGYLAVWSDDAVLVGGRGPSEGPHDLTLNRQQLEATKRLRFSGNDSFGVFTPTDATVELEGKLAEVRWRMTSGSDEFVEVVDELYRLRKTEEGWRVYLNRYWFVEAGPKGRLVARDAAFYEAQDKAATEAKAAGDSAAEFEALAAGGRFKDAFQVLQEGAKEDSEPEAWGRLAIFAVIVGEVEEAKKAACKARAITPTPSLPKWAESVTCP